MFSCKSTIYQNRTSLSAITRVGEWWEYKLAPIFATFYATAFLLKLPLHELAPLFIIVLLALAPGAAYVSVINDVTDIRDDLASGKANRLVGKPRWLIVTALACSILPGAIFAWLWRSDPLLLGFYGAAWIVFSLYSVPPFRFKHRGFWGMLADAAGSNFFPHLVVVVLIFRRYAIPLDFSWLACVGFWSLFYGLRGILWHQLCDLKNDEKINLNTFARLHPLPRLKRMGKWIIFPVEVAFFTAILWQLGSVIPLGFLAFYMVLERLRATMWGVRIIIVAPQERFRIAMQEYYDVFYPISLLLASATTHRLDVLVLLAHVLLFPNRISTTIGDIGKIFSDKLRYMRLKCR